MESEAMVRQGRANTIEADLADDAGLVGRFRAGDAEAVGEFLERFGPVIRAHFRRKIGPSMRRLVDSQDLLSTITRRLCQRVLGHRVEAENGRQLWALVYRIGNDALVDRVRVVSRLRSLEEAGSPFVNAMRQRLDGQGNTSETEFAEQLALMLTQLDTPEDRELLVRWLHGESLADAGASLGINAPAARKRWQRIRERLQQIWYDDKGTADE